MRGLTSIGLGVVLLCCGACSEEASVLTEDEAADVGAVILEAVESLHVPSARFYVYTCADFNTGCTGTVFMINDTCVPHTDLIVDSCYDTGFDVVPDTTYSLRSCNACDSGCSASVEFTTPVGFFADTYFRSIGWFCADEESCSTPALCP